MKRKRFLKKEHNPKKQIVMRISFVTIIIVAIIGIIYFKKTHFKLETFIQGVDCSYLTVEDAKIKIEKEVNNQQITLKIILPYEQQSNKVYELTTEQIQSFDIALSSTEQLQLILEQQVESLNNHYHLTEAFEVNYESVREYLMEIPELQQDNMVVPQDAFLKVNENGLLEIEPEIHGNQVDFEEACEYMIQCLKNGENQIDFSSITKTEPDIKSDNANLLTQMEEVNSILLTTINFKLDDGSIITLDINIMKEWVYQKEDGTYAVDIANNLPQFIEKLSQIADSQKSSIVFNASELGEITLPLKKSLREKVNKEEEFLQIQKELGTAQTYERTPIYEENSIQNQMTSYVELDITRQTVWLYKNGTCILKTPCVTGSVAGGHSTPTGIYFLSYKTTDAVLRGFNNDGSRYASPVDYWMPFNGGIGFHDASWRNGVFGGEIYKTDGSHGCVNLPFEAAKTLYQNIDKTMPIIVYKS